MVEAPKQPKVTTEVERWGKVSQAVINHVVPRSMTALSTYEGALCTCVRYSGSGSLVVEFEGETNTPTTPTNVSLWKQLHFQIVMEVEEEGTKVDKEDREEEKKSTALLPFLHAFSSSRKKRVLFKIPLFEATVITGSQIKLDTQGTSPPSKYKYAFGISTPSGTVAFVTATSEEVSEWTSELTKVRSSLLLRVPYEAVSLTCRFATHSSLARQSASHKT